MKKISVYLIAFLLLSSCQSVVEESYIEPSYPVHAHILSTEDRIEYVKYVGILQPEKVVQKTFDNLAEIEKIYVEEGDKVKVGQLLATQNTDDLEASKEELSIQIETDKANEEAARQEMLADKASYDQALASSDADLATLKANRDSAEAQMNEDADTLNAAQNAYDIKIAAQEDASVELAALNTARTNYNTSSAEYQQAQAEYDFAIENGTTTEVEVAQAQYEASLARYEASQSQRQLTQTQYDNLDQQIQGSYLYSNIDGYVLMLNAEVGETANPLVPVMILGTSETVVTIGLSQDNVRKVKPGMSANVEVGDLSFEGEVLDINRIPDTSSRTYETNIAFPEDLLDFFIGENAIVNINVGLETGIWIPIKVIQNDGEDYVYVIVDHRAKKKIITPLTIANDYVLVEGLDEGDHLIIDGMKNVKAGSLVEVIAS